MQHDDHEIEPTCAADRTADARTEANLRAFRAHWEACRLGADVPRRVAIDPREIEPLISNAFIVERVAPGVARLRVAGLHLNDLMGMEARGMPLSCLVAPDDRDSFSSAVVDLFDGPATLRINLRGRKALGQPALSGTMLLLPLRSDLGDVSRALGCLVSHGRIGRPVRRFSIERIARQPLSEVGAEAHAPRLRAIAGGAPPEATRPRGGGSLRLVT